MAPAVVYLTRRAGALAGSVWIAHSCRSCATDGVSALVESTRTYFVGRWRVGIYGPAAFPCGFRCWCSVLSRGSRGVRPGGASRGEGSPLNHWPRPEDCWLAWQTGERRGHFLCVTRKGRPGADRPTFRQGMHEGAGGTGKRDEVDRATGLCPSAPSSGLTPEQARKRRPISRSYPLSCPCGCPCNAAYGQQRETMAETARQSTATAEAQEPKSVAEAAESASHRVVCGVGRVARVGLGGGRICAAGAEWPGGRRVVSGRCLVPWTSRCNRCDGCVGFEPG